MRFLELVAGLALLGKGALGLTPDEWRSQSIYFMLTDRFARTDGSTDAPCDLNARGYCGGTFKGIIDQLDYIQGMGFTAIWITPVTEQIADETSEGTSFHGYWQKNIYGIEPKYGTADDLKALSKALHDRGMYLMVDVVANHMGFAGPGDKTDFSIYNPFNKASYFHPYCPIDNYDDQKQSEGCWLGSKVVSLPDLDTTKEEVRKIWYDWIGNLVSNYSIDGLRVDTVKHVEKDFWPGFNKAAGVYCVGEVLQGDAAYTCPYQEVMDGVMNYPIYYPILEAFKTKGSSMSNLGQMMGKVAQACKDPGLLGSFIENHDNARFPSYTEDIKLAMNAIGFTFFADGIPILYYGQEQHFKGKNDPFNREALWLSKYDTKAEIYQFVAKTNKIRSTAISKDKGYISARAEPIHQEGSTFAMKRGSKGSQVITVLTNAGSDGGSDPVSLPNSGYSGGTKLMELITCNEVEVDSSGNIPVPMEGGAPRVLAPAEWAENICGGATPTGTTKSKGGNRRRGGHFYKRGN